MYTVLVSLGVLIIIILSAVAWHLQSKVNAKRKKQLEDLAQVKQERSEYLNSSIQILAQGIIDDQLTLTEGSIRIAVLIDNLALEDAAKENIKEEYSAFYQLTDALAHIPILKAWKALPKKKKQSYEKERLAVEADYKEFVIDAAKRIRGESF